MELAYVDQGYTGSTTARAVAEHGIHLSVVKLPEAKRGFVLLPRRWVIERSFAWAARLRQARRRKLISEDHFSVDGTLLQAWAALKSVRPRDNDEEPPAGGSGRNPDVDFKGQQRANATHVSTTDPQARLARKGSGQETKLCYAGHLLTENRNGLILGALVTEATGTAEREAALQLLDQRLTPHKRVTLGADKGYDTKTFVEALREREVTPGGRKLPYVGLAKNQHWAIFTAVAYNLIRIPKLEPHAA